MGEQKDRGGFHAGDTHFHLKPYWRFPRQVLERQKGPRRNGGTPRYGAALFRMPASRLLEKGKLLGRALAHRDPAPF